MIDKGANPFVVKYSGESEFHGRHLSYLPNLPTKKSVYFTIHPINDKFKAKTNFRDSWVYQTGVFDGKFDSLIGRGASGIILKGKWCGKMAAFKFVDIGTQEFPANVSAALKSLNEQLFEMKSIQEAEGSKILTFYGHYRLVRFAN